MRERLIELLKEADKYASGVCTDYDEAQEVCADYLLAEGIIVPPCKVGDKVYRIIEANSLTPYVYDWEIVEIRVYQDEIVCIDDSDNPVFVDEIGKTVFLTKEEAEKALAEREGKG